MPTHAFLEGRKKGHTVDSLASLQACCCYPACRLPPHYIPPTPPTHHAYARATAATAHLLPACPPPLPPPAYHPCPSLPTPRPRATTLPHTTYPPRAPWLHLYHLPATRLPVAPARAFLPFHAHAHATTTFACLPGILSLAGRRIAAAAQKTADAARPQRDGFTLWVPRTNSITGSGCLPGEHGRCSPLWFRGFLPSCRVADRRHPAFRAGLGHSGTNGKAWARQVTF